METTLARLRKRRTIWPPFRVAAAVIGLPLGLVGMACVPGLNVLIFSGHGGPGWLVLPLCFPVLLLNTYRRVVRPAREKRSAWRRFAAISVAYLVFAYPFAVVAEHRITKDSGLPIADRTFYRLMTFPVGMVFSLWRTTH